MKKRYPIGLAISLMIGAVGTLFAESQPAPLSATASTPSDQQGGGEAGKGVIYSPVGKRDPFRATAEHARELASINPLEKYSIEQFQLRAILQGDGQNKAMFEDPDGNPHILGEGEAIGREHGTVSKILNKGVIVTEKTFNYLGQESLFEKVISLPEK
jgi:hypothetical protein